MTPRTRLLAALVLAAAALAPAAHAGNAPVDDYARFADATGWNTQKKMARAEDGSLYYVFVAPLPEEALTRLVIVHERADGTTETLPSPRAARGDVARPTLALDAQGRLWVSWTERAEDDREVFAARWDGDTWADVEQLSGGKGYAGFPSLASDAQGRLHVAWYGYDGLHYQPFYRRHSAEGWEPAVQLSSGTLDANNPSVVVDRDGGVHVAWYKSDGRQYRIWYAHHVAGADGWTLPHAVSKGAGEAMDAALAVDAQDRVHAVWDEVHGDGYHVKHAVRGKDGAWSAPTTLAQGPRAGAYPAVAAWGEGVLVVWAVNSEGTLLATDLTGEPQPFLGGVKGRNPSLRGPSPWPLSERAPMLDVMYTTLPDNAGERDVVRATLHPACDWREPLDACPGGARSVPTIGPGDQAQAPVPGFPAALALIAAALSGLWRTRRYQADGCLTIPAHRRRVFSSVATKTRRCRTLSWRSSRR